MSIPSPVFNQEYVFLGNAGGREKPGTVLYQAGSSGDVTPRKEIHQQRSGLDLAGIGIANPSLYCWETTIRVVQ